MSAQLAGFFDGLKKVRAAMHEQAITAHQVALAELHLDDGTASVTALTDAEQATCLAARDLTRAVDGLPMGRRPKGWGT